MLKIPQSGQLPKPPVRVLLRPENAYPCGLWLITLTLLIAPMSQASELRLFLGQYDLGADSADSHYGVEWATGRQLTDWNLEPVVGLQRSRYASHYLYSGLQRHTPLTETGSLQLGVGLASGLYLHGGQDDTDLGYPLQFTSSLELQFQASDGTTLSIRGAHSSNASLSTENPGTEWVAFFYGLPL